jgi:sugar phosphate permease
MTGLHGANGWSGWQWVFLLEGIPSVIAGIVTLLYLTDRPEKAGHWLSGEERRRIAEDLERDRAALGAREHSMFAALKNPRIWQFVAVYFCIIMANSALTFFGPTIVREVGFASPAAVGWIMAAIYLCGAAGMILNGTHSDRQGEARLHCGLSALAASAALVVLGVLVPGSPVPALAALGVAVVGTMSAIPVFWQMPNRFLAGTAAAAGVAFINSIANLAGFAAPYLMGAIKDGTGSLSYGLWLVALFEALTVFLILYFIPGDARTAAAAAPQEDAMAEAPATGAKI